MYGDGHCAVCPHQIRRGKLMCAQHWFRVPRWVRDKVYAALDAWEIGLITVGELRDVQDLAVLLVGGKPAVAA